MSLSREFGAFRDPVSAISHAAAQAEDATRAQRQDKARHVLAAYAVEQDDPRAWLTDILDALGLLHDRDTAPGVCRGCGADLPVYRQAKAVTHGYCGVPCARLHAVEVS